MTEDFGRLAADDERAEVGKAEDFVERERDEVGCCFGGEVEGGCGEEGGGVQEGVGAWFRAVIGEGGWTVPGEVGLCGPCNEGCTLCWVPG